MSRARRLAGIGLLCALPVIAAAQESGDFFASQDNYWNGKRRDFPQCTGLVDRHEALTRELYELDAQARRSVEPQRRQLVGQLNEKARERSAVQRELDACTRQVTLQGRVETREPDLRLDRARRAQAFQLSAQVNAAARNLGDAAGQFLEGVLDWARATLELLAQRPGEPLNQMAQGIATYLTNNNAANHAMLRAQAEQAVRQFQANPARFTGQLVPNLIPLPKAQALAQLARVEAGASRALAVAANQQRFTRAYDGMRAAARRSAARPGVGITTPENACFAQNACFPTAMAQDILWRSEEPFVIQGVQATAAQDLTTSAGDLFATLRRHNDPGFAPRQPGLFNPEQLDTIWQGVPLQSDLDQMATWLRSNGEGSQAIVIAEFKPSVVPAGQPAGHAFNMRFEKGEIEVLDRTNLRFDLNDVEKWWFFPTR